jgi:hypothetical protein
MCAAPYVHVCACIIHPVPLGLFTSRFIVATARLSARIRSFSSALYLATFYGLRRFSFPRVLLVDFSSELRRTLWRRLYNLLLPVVNFGERAFHRGAAFRRLVAFPVDFGGPRGIRCAQKDVIFCRIAYR